MAIVQLTTSIGICRDYIGEAGFDTALTFILNASEQFGKKGACDAEFSNQLYASASSYSRMHPRHTDVEYPNGANLADMLPRVNSLPTGGVSISGTTTEGEILTADTSNLADVDGLGALSYRSGLRDGADISGADVSNLYTHSNRCGRRHFFAC